MNMPFACSIIYGGILGGWIYIGGDGLNYRTGKVTVSENIRNLKIPYDDIKEITWKTVLFPVATVSLKNNEDYRFLIFNKKRFEKNRLRVMRIREMEDILNRAKDLLKDPQTNSEALKDFQPRIKALEEYYMSSLWKEDFAADEAGKLPKDLKRGVLSEDGVYDMLSLNKETMESLG